MQQKLLLSLTAAEDQPAILSAWCRQFLVDLADGWLNCSWIINLPSYQEEKAEEGVVDRNSSQERALGEGRDCCQMQAMQRGSQKDGVICQAERLWLSCQNPGPLLEASTVAE